MSVSYGTITITDSTDLGQLTAYLTSDKYKQQHWIQIQAIISLIG